MIKRNMFGGAVTALVAGGILSSVLSGEVFAEQCTGPGGGTGGVGQPGYWVSIPADNNPNDTTNYGRVTYEYSMLERPVTVAEYVTFLNAVDPGGGGTFTGALDDYGLVGYSSGQWRTLAYTGCNSVAQSFTAATTGKMLVSLVSLNQAARYANWVATGNINQGAYSFSSTTNGNANISSIDSTWKGIRLPTENEYYKAAYWNPTSRTYSRYGTTSLDGSGYPYQGTVSSTGLISSTQHPFPYTYTTDSRGNCMVYIQSGQGGRSAYGLSNLVGGFHDMMHPDLSTTSSMVLRPDNQFSNSAVSGTGDGVGDFPYEHQRSTWRWAGVPTDQFYSSPSFRLVQSPSACSYGSLTVTKSVTGKPAGFTSPNFPVTVNCGGTISNFNLQDGGSNTISNILEGTTCTITEGTLPAPPSGYTYGTPTISPSSVTIPVSTTGTSTSTVSITNPLQASCSINSFSITPVCNNNATTGTAADDYRTFSLNLSGTAVSSGYNLSVNNGGTVTPTSGNYGSATGFRLQNGSAGNGTTYTLTATDSANSSCTSSASITDPGSCSPTGSLQVSKTVSGDLTGFDNPDFTIAVSCTNGLSQNLTIKNGASQTITGIPTGTTCNISEPTQPAPPSGHAYAAPVISPSSVSIGNGTTVSVSVTNPLNAVSCPVITVTPNPLTNGTVGVAYSASPSASASDSGSHTYTWSASGLPAGLSVNSGSGAVSGTPTATGNATITASTTVAGQTCSGTTALTVNPAPTGSLTVSKVVTGQPSGFTSPNFSIQVDCTVDTFDQTLTLTAGNSQTISGIPTNASCTVTELALPAAPSGYNYGTPVISPSGPQTIGNGTTVSVSVTNPLSKKLGSLSVSKVVTGAPSGFTSPNYTLHVDCSDNTFDQDVTVTAGNSQTISSMPDGTTCTVTEPSQPAPPSGYSYGTAVITPSGAVTIVGDTTVSVSVENPLTGDCALNPPVVTTQCHSNGTADASDDTFSFNINASGNFTSATYDIQGGGLSVLAVPYGIDAGSYGNFLITGGDVSLTVSDSGNATCQLSAINAPAPAPCSITPVCTTIGNIAGVTGMAETDDNTGNDRDGAVVRANCAPAQQIDLELSKTADQTTVGAGDTVVYTLTVTNKGPDDAQNVAVTDNLPSEVTYVSSKADRGTYNPTSGIWTIGDVASGIPLRLQITVTVN